MREPLSLFLAAVLLALLPQAGAQQPPPAAVADTNRVGTFKQVEGEIWVGPGEARRTPVPGDGLHEAERLRTGKTGAATITLKDGTVVTMGPDTLVELSRFQYNPTTQSGQLALELLQGSIRVVTGLLAKINPELFKITTPTSVVGVRGTDFIVDAPAQP